ncbi:MAG: cyclopropane-fatty-acyl-phospholipid synthase family protein [Cyanobacteriota bacterium]
MVVSELQRSAASAGSQPDHPWAIALPPALRTWLEAAFQQLSAPICLDFWGREQLWVHCNANEPPTLTLQIRHPGIVRSLLMRRDPLVLVEGYLNGDCDFVGDLETLIMAMQQLGRVPIPLNLATLQAARAALSLPSLKTQLSSSLEKTRHTPEQDRAAIHHHYDMGNDFYQLWLDPQMVYSCAYFEDEQMSLAEAQAAKLDLICRKLRLSPGETLLDIGCGWGALLRWAVERYGVHGFGITLSQAQLDYNRAKIVEAGLENRLRVELMDYRDLPQTPTFDKIVSVGMVEHVGRRNLPVYFQSIGRSLKPGGLFLNHGITASTEWNGSSLGERFINRYIFPHGELVRLSTILEAAESAGWEVVDVDAWRLHYAKTLRCWEANLQNAAAQAERLLGEAMLKRKQETNEQENHGRSPEILSAVPESEPHRYLQLWRAYLLGSALGFEKNQMGLYQTLLRPKADTSWNLPLTRSGWLV